jgi:hypothetical protein
LYEQTANLKTYWQGSNNMMYRQKFLNDDKPVLAKQSMSETRPISHHSPSKAQGLNEIIEIEDHPPKSSRNLFNNTQETYKSILKQKHLNNFENALITNYEARTNSASKVVRNEVGVGPSARNKVSSQSMPKRSRQTQSLTRGATQDVANDGGASEQEEGETETDTLEVFMQGQTQYGQLGIGFTN